MCSIEASKVSFSFADAAEAVHAHLARIPDSPHRRLPSIPEQLSAIVMTLLAKAPEDRYQSHDDLTTDLERVRAYAKDAFITPAC